MNRARRNKAWGPDSGCPLLVGPAGFEPATS